MSRFAPPNRSQIAQRPLAVSAALSLAVAHSASVVVVMAREPAPA
jgi:hypothetical protein